MLAAFVDEFTADLRLGVTIREAAAVDKFTAELHAVTTSEEKRDDLRRAAILIGQLGLTSADIEPMARQWMTSPHRTYYELMMAARRVEEQAQAFAPREDQ
jgi:hypothetical protein